MQEQFIEEDERNSDNSNSASESLGGFKNALKMKKLNQ
jgi:hypothetical protein